MIEQTAVIRANWDEVPKYLYTCTYAAYLESIAMHGMGNRCFRTKMGGDYTPLYNADGFFLSVDPKEAIMYMSEDERSKSDLVVLQVPKSCLMPFRLFYDLNNVQLLDYFNGNITGFSKNQVTYFYDGIIVNPHKKFAILDY